MADVQIQTVSTPGELAGMLGYRPTARLSNGAAGMVINEQGFPVFTLNRGLSVNSLLRKDEWERLDAAIVRRIHQILNVDRVVSAAGLTVNLGGLGTMVSQWNIASEKPLATAAMDTRTGGNADRVDNKLYGVPVPVLFSDYSIGERELLASRRMGNDLEVIEAEEAAQAVAEKLEDMWINGDSNINVGGVSIAGLTSITGRETNTAANYGGGGDFGTITNVEKTFNGVLGAMAAKRYRGPWAVFVAPTQYYQLLAFHTDGSGQTALARVMTYPNIQSIQECPQLDDGEVVFVQLTSSVVDKAIALEVTNREWMSPDGSASHFRVIGAMVPRIKTDYAGNVGVAHVTAA